MNRSEHVARQRQQIQHAEGVGGGKLAECLLRHDRPQKPNSLVGLSTIMR